MNLECIVLDYIVLKHFTNICPGTLETRIPPTSMDLSLVYFFWVGYEELERNLEKEHVVLQRDFTCFFRL